MACGPVNWDLLRLRLENQCPSKASISTLSSVDLASQDEEPVVDPKPGTMYILQVEVEDRVGQGLTLLHFSAQRKRVL